VSDGAAALVLTDSETARTMGKAVNIRATAHAQDFLPMSKRDILQFEGCSVAWQQALQKAGVTAVLRKGPGMAEAAAELIENSLVAVLVAS